MPHLKKVISGAAVFLLVLYFTPLIVEGLRPSTATVRGSQSGFKTAWSIGHVMAYSEYGAGYPVILVHGFGESMLVWDAAVKALGDAGFTVYAVDLLGHGMSDKPYGYRYRLESYADQLRDFMEALKIPRAHLVGHSMGGAVVMKFACMYPPLVNRIALIGSAGVRHESGGAVFSLLRVPLLGEFLLLFNFKPVLKKGIHSINFNGMIEIGDEYIDRYSLPAALRGFNYMFLNILRNFSSPLWSAEDCMEAIKAPALIIHGTADRIIPIAAAERMHTRLQNSILVTVPDGPHGVMETHPGIVNESIHRFLK